MIDFRPIFFVCGILLATLAVVMAIPAIADAAVGSGDWQVFALSALLTLFVGGLLILMNRAPSAPLSIRQAFLLTAVGWVVVAAFGALPFAFSDLRLSYTDAFFEAMSGITTTGSTVIAGLDNLPPGILLWRALLQWLGGIGIVLVAVTVLPMLRIGGMQLFKVEAFDRPETVLPRAAQIATGIALTYIVLTILFAGALWGAGMTPFDAAAHAMTGIATGGFSTKSASIGFFNSTLIDWIMVAGMIAGSLPFVYYLPLWRGRWRPLITDSQVRAFFRTALFGVLAVTIWLWLVDHVAPVEALTETTFNVVSMMTGTGFTIGNFDSWGGLPMVILFFIMFVGGCAGSTTSGIKIFRFQVAYASAKVQIARLMQPNGVFLPHYNRRPISEAVALSVIGFFFLFFIVFSIEALILGLLGLDFVTAISGAATTIANVGPGLGNVIGPAGNFAGLPDAAKWVLAAGMLLGRLELFTVLILFLPSFWRG